MKLIDKDTLVAEIESLLDKGRYHEEYDCAYRDGNNGALYALKDKLDTLEVKEVDLEKEFSQWWKGERAKDYNVDILYERYSNVSIKLAKHFFELGMSVNNKAQKGEKV